MTTPATIPRLTAQSPVTIVSGETGQPVSGAVVSSGAAQASSDSAGQAAIAGGSERVAVRAEGFLVRDTLLRAAADTRIVLWPMRSGFDDTFAREMAYSALVNPARTLTRPTGPVVLVLAPGVGAGLTATAQAAAAAMTAANGGVVTYHVADAAPAGGIVFTVDVNAAEPFFAAHPGTHAMTEIRYAGHRVVGGRIVFRELEYGQLQGPFLHELGHTFGAGHPQQPGLMNGIIRRGDTSFSPAERLAFSLMAQRRPGNAFPDDDTAVTGASAQRRVLIAD